MNHNETGYLQETIPGRQSSALPVRALARQKGKHSFPGASRGANAQKKTKRTFSPLAYISGPHVQPQTPITSIAGGNVSFTGLGAIHHWRIAD